MTHIIRSNNRHYSDMGWLQTRWHFSFGDYHDPQNMNWSVLRVFNDDVVQGGEGFGSHPHRDMEIVTYVIDGALEHSDSLGNKEALKASEVQVMSAGKGIIHAEYNHDPDMPVHFLQLWIMPRTKGTTPRWDQRPFAVDARKGSMMPIVSDGSVAGTLVIDQDVVIQVGKLAVGQTIESTLKGTHAYLFVIKGSVDLNGQKLDQGDQARLADEKSLKIISKTDSHLILLDLP